MAFMMPYSLKFFKMNIELPEDMDVPEMRRDTTKLSNLTWLVRNLSIRNSKHPKLKEVLSQILNKIKEMTNG